MVERAVSTTYERFWACVDRSAGPNECWPWTGMLTPRGVPVFEVRGRRTTARRYAYRMQYGDPGKLRVVVTCELAICMNWDHLSVSTARAIALTNGSAAAHNAAREFCDRGHKLTDDVLYTHPGDGRRECAECKVARRPGHTGLYFSNEAWNLSARRH
jgi:hypothetical protein